MVKRFLPYCIIAFVSLLYTIPFFRPGYFPTHDGEWAIVRLAEMKRELRDGQFPPRWSEFLNHGYGYPLFHFTYPLPYYAGGLISSMGIGLTDTVKILFVFSVFFSGYFMFLLGKELTNVYGGVIAALFYVSAPFRLVDLYVRGSIGESLSFVLFPVIFLSIYNFLKFPNVLRMIICSISIASLILTHNAMAFLFVPYAALFFFVFSYVRKLPMYLAVKYFLQIMLLSFGLAAYFWLPALVEKQYIALSQAPLADIKENFISFAKLIIPSWSFGIQPPFQLGIFHIAASIIGIAAIQKKAFSIFIIFSIGTLVFLTQKISLPLWTATPLSIIDFPWRLLAPLSIFLSLAASYSAKIKPLMNFALVIAGCAVIFNFQYVKPAEYIERPDSYYETNDATTTSNDELMPVWVKEKPKNRYAEKVETVSGNATISDLDYNSHTIRFTADASEESFVSINTIYFPGWKFYGDGQKLAINYDNPKGIITFPLEAGKHHVNGEFTETPIRTVSNIISLISFGFILIFFVYSKLRFLGKPG